MFKLRKGLAAVAAITMMSTVSMSALAAPSASYQLGNNVFTATCSLGSKSGTGTSKFTAKAGLTVNVRYDYNYGANYKEYDQTYASSADGDVYSVSATASAKPGYQNVKSVRVEATHTVSYQGGSKTLSTNA